MSLFVRNGIKMYTLTQIQGKKMKNWFCALVISGGLIAASWIFISTNRYGISGSGGGAIMIDKSNGRTWVLEFDPKPNARLYVGPNKMLYVWVPANVTPDKTYSLCNTPQEAIKKDEWFLS